MREGLTISTLNNEESDNQMSRHSWTPIDQERWWRIEYSKKYKSVTASFMKAVAAGGEKHLKFTLTDLHHAVIDPDAFWTILGKLPWHADTLLQLSEVYRYREGKNLHQIQQLS